PELPFSSPVLCPPHRLSMPPSPKPHHRAFAVCQTVECRKCMPPPWLLTRAASSLKLARAINSLLGTAFKQIIVDADSSCPIQLSLVLLSDRFCSHPMPAKSSLITGWATKTRT